jgi:undecaprenyl-diphosphatase
MLEYVILAILQGLVEWLPISSSGQVVIFSINILGISPENAFTISIWLHLGTALAVLVKMRKEYFNIVKTIIFKKERYGEKDVKLRNWLIYATLATAVTALPLYFLLRFFILNAFSATSGDIVTLIISGLLIITGLVLFFLKRSFGKKSIEDQSFKQIRKDSSISGLIQGIAILPGISRSGFTVSTILFEKYDQDQSLNLSFLMSAPVVIANIGVDVLFGGGSVFGTLDILTILVTTAISFIIGYLTMGGLLKVARKINFSYFCIFYGVIAFIFILPVLIIT